MEFLELVENIQTDAAHMASAFNRLAGEDGYRSVRGAQAGPRYLQALAEAARFLADVHDGRKPFYLLREAMTTSDFPLLFGDILDRQMLAAYREQPQVWRNFTKVASVADFRSVKRFPYISGADNRLSLVPEGDAYPETKLTDQTAITYAVQKYGRKLPFSWEALVNDDLGAFSDIPDRFGRAARRTESEFVTGLYVDANGPHASLYTAGNANKVTGNPALSITGLATAVGILASAVDGNGEPIDIEEAWLVVPPQLEVTGLTLLNATQIWLNPNLAAGTAEQQVIAQNWMQGRVKLLVEPYIPVVASVANGATSWFLFADIRTGNPALEAGFLRGHESPEIFMKTANAVRVGGGALNPTDGDFDTDSIQYKLRHILGGARIDAKMTVASNGSGVP